MQVTPGSKRGIFFFFATLVSLAIVRVLLQSYADVPITVLPVANALMGALFLGGPLLALCFAARDSWNPQVAAKFVVIGVVIQVGCVLLNKHVFHHHGLTGQIVNATGQVGLPMWCVGLGALLATLIKDKNIIVPIAIFLGFLDMFLVFSPLGVTRVLIGHFPGLLPAIAVQVPRAAHVVAKAKVSPGSLAGPADFLFLAMFLIAIFRFNMRGRLTVLIVIPTLIAYMFLVTVLNFSLPALVPIGTVVLIVNWKEFKLTKDEKVSTIGVAIAGLALFTWGMFQKPTTVQADPSPTAAAQGSPESPTTR